MKIPVHFQNGYNRLCIILCAAALLSGGILYFFRPEKILLLRWSSTNLLINKFLVLPFHPSDWMIFSLPDGLWAFAYTLSICVIWSGSRSWLKYFWLTSAPILVFGAEIVQYFKLIPGTFCFLDLVLGSAGLAAGFLLGTLKKQ